MFQNIHWIPIGKRSLTFHNVAASGQSRLPPTLGGCAALISLLYTLIPAELSFEDLCLENHPLCPPLFITPPRPRSHHTLPWLSCVRSRPAECPSLPPNSVCIFNNAHWTVITTLGHSVLGPNFPGDQLCSPSLE